ncbi:protein IMPACT-like, partial [Scleropages formosus]
IDEIEALSSIYGDEWCVIDEASRIFCIKISGDINTSKWTICLQIILPHDYPSAAPPIYQLNGAWLRGPERVELSNSLEEIYVQNAGECILYLWVERIREFLLEKSQSCDSDEELPPIKHGEAITDRRSTFQPHLAPVVTPRQVLYHSRQAVPFHTPSTSSVFTPSSPVWIVVFNLVPCRDFGGGIFCEDKHTFLQDCEDDGETAAGGRLLHLLQILDVRNVMVVVSRWYGGILLGPDRFKHICNCARNILVQEGYTESAGHGKFWKPSS